MKTETHYEKKPWLASYDDGVPEHIEYEKTFLTDMLTRTAERYPDRAALVFEGKTITYRALKTMVENFAACLQSLGVGKGDSVAILLPNLVPAVVSYHATLTIGAIAVMNNPLYTDPELMHQFNDSGAKVLITLDLLANRMINLRPATSIEKIIYTTIGDYLPFPQNILFKLFAKKKKMATTVTPADNVYTWKECVSGPFGKCSPVSIDSDDVAMYQYTGGTTGVSKGVRLTHDNLSRQVQQFMAWAPSWLAGHETMLGALPFFHMFGLSTSMNLPIYGGWTSILMPRPKSDLLLKAIARYRPTLATMVPTMIIGMLNDPLIGRTDISCFRTIISGGSPLAVDVMRKFEADTGAVIIEGYGLTEASPVTHVNPVGGKPRKVGSVGLPFPDTECRVVDLEEGTVNVPFGEMGELLIRGPQVMKGYLNMSDETKYALRDGWLYTGDIVTMDEEGYFYIVDRKKDLIISSGYNIYPRDIDEVFYSHPKVREACAIGIPDPKRGENVKVLVVLKDGETATPDEFIDYCKTRLARYKHPTEIEFRADLPKSNIGKILRKQLKEEERLRVQGN